MPDFHKKSMEELGRLSANQALEDDTQPIILVLDNIRSMQNVGAIFRSADAFGVQLIILLGITPSPPHREIRKSALGAEEAVKWVKVSKWQEAQTYFPDEYVLASLEQTHGSTALHTYQPTNLLHILVVGNEVQGVSDEILSESFLTLEIEQRGHKHSLNVATSAGILLYHLCQVHPISP